MCNLKNIWSYYFSIITPLILLFLLVKFLHINSALFIICFVFYLIIYRPIIDGNRLYYKKVIKKEERWKILIPFFRLKYFKELYFKK